MLAEMKCFSCGSTSRRVKDVCPECRWHKCPSCGMCLCVLSEEQKTLARAVDDTNRATIDMLALALRFIADETMDDDSVARMQGVATFALYQAGL